jgi:hypothetical protein
LDEISEDIFTPGILQMLKFKGIIPEMDLLDG